MMRKHSPNNADSNVSTPDQCGGTLRHICSTRVGWDLLDLRRACFEWTAGCELTVSYRNRTIGVAILFSFFSPKVSSSFSHAADPCSILIG
jgi:hypothetical protein